jgi:hypothetical protein
MTYSFNVVPIWTDDEGAVVVWVVLWSQPRFSIVFAAGCECRGVELPYLLAVLCRKGDVYWPWATTK